MKKIIFVSALMLILLPPGINYAYLPLKTHPLINNKAVKASTVDSYIKSQLGLVGGIQEIVNGKPIIEWMQEGGTDEDNNTRGVNHFHDPTKLWDYAGILETGYSSLQWAQDHTVGKALSCADLLSLGVNGSCPEPPPSSNPSRSWPGSRKSFYDALTSKVTGIREQYFADTFKYLGHVMHLLADAAVPEHARNDSHMIFNSRYERWAEDHADNQGLLPLFIADKSLLYAIDYTVVIGQSNVAGYNHVSN